MRDAYAKNIIHFLIWNSKLTGQLLYFCLLDLSILRQENSLQILAAKKELI